MELRHLRYLVAVADAATFSGAAQQIGVAQPALTRQLRELERELGTSLFVSGARRATLTPAGEAAVQVARHVRDEIHHAVERVRLAQRGLAGRCVVCVSRAPMMQGLPARLVQLARQRCPAITIEIVEGEFKGLWDAIGNGVADIGIGQPPSQSYRAISSETQAQHIVDSAVLASNHPLASRSSIRLEQLHDLPFVWVDTLDESQQVYAIARTELLRRGFPARNTRAVQSTDAIAALVKAQQGWSAIPRQIVPALMPGLVGVPLEDFAVPVQYARLWRRADKRPVTLTVLELLRVLENAGRDEAIEAGEGSENNDPTFIPPRLELRHLRTYVRVVDAGSVGRAAEELGVTQPALSRQMRDLEYDVGVPLLERGTRGARPTVAGESLYKDAQDLLAAADGIKASAQRAERGSSGQCILATGPLPLVQELVTHALHQCKSNYGCVDVAVIDMAWPKMTRALKDASIDVGLGFGPHGSRPVAGIRRVVVAADPLDTALVSPQHPLASRGSIKLQELSETPFLFVSRSFSSVFFDRVMVAFAESGFSARMEASYDGAHTIWTMAAGGLGWSLAPRSQRAAPPPGTVPIRLEDLSIPWDVELLYRRDESRAPVLALIDAIQSQAVKPGVEAPAGFQITPSTTSKAAIS